MTTNQLVKEIYVKEGDEVKIGDPLLAYDMTLAELDLEMEQLNGNAIDLQITAAEKDLEKLKNETPISASAEADIMKNGQVMVAASEEGGTEGTDPGTEPAPASAEGTSEAAPPVTEPPQTEPPVTEAPQTEPPVTEPSQTEPPVTEAPQTNAPQTDTSQTNAPQTDASQTDASQTESQTGGETDQSTEPNTGDTEQTTEPNTDATEVTPQETEVPMIIDITVVVNQQIDESLRPEKVKVTLNDTVLNVSKETVELTKENNWTYKYLAMPIGGTYSLTTDAGDAYDIQSVYDEKIGRASCRERV